MSSEVSLIDTWQFWAAFGAMIVIASIGIWKRSRESDPVLAAITGLKFLSGAYCVFFLMLIISLPAMGSWMYREPYELKSLEEAARQQKELGLDLTRLKDVAWWLLFLMFLWFINLLPLLKVIATERKKTSNGNAP